MTHAAYMQFQKKKKKDCWCLESYSPTLAIYYALGIFCQRCHHIVCSSYSFHIVVVKLEACVFFCSICPWCRHSPVDWNLSYKRLEDSIASTGTPLTGMLRAGKNASSLSPGQRKTRGMLLFTVQTGPLKLNTVASSRVRIKGIVVGNSRSCQRCTVHRLLFRCYELRPSEDAVASAA